MQGPRLLCRWPCSNASTRDNTLTITDLHYLDWRFQAWWLWIAWRQARTKARSLLPTSAKTQGNTCRVNTCFVKLSREIRLVPELSELSPLQADASLHVQSPPSLPVFNGFQWWVRWCEMKSISASLGASQAIQMAGCPPSSKYLVWLSDIWKRNLLPVVSNWWIAGY